MVVALGQAAAVRSSAQRTADYVRIRGLVGGRERRRAVPRAKYPTLIESDYARRLMGILDWQRQRLAPLLAELPAMSAAARLRFDEAQQITRHGLPIVIELRAGSVRRWHDANGTSGETKMLFDYGSIRGFLGADGEDVDVYLGPAPSSTRVFVAHQMRKSSDFTEYDEDKVMLGWETEDAARAAYLAQYGDPRFLRSISAFEIDEFKRRLRKAVGHAITENVAWRTDAGTGRQARVLLDRVRDEALTSMSGRADEAAQVIAERVGSHHRRELDRQTKAGLGVVVPVADRKVPGIIDGFVHENVALIKSLGGKQIDDLEKLITRAFADGVRHETLAKQIAERFKIGERHARLIARDQIGKLNGQITRARHEELGIGTFEWLDAGDNRVRPRHAAMKRTKVWAYRPGFGAPVPPFFPGQEVCCRCSEKPRMDDILALLDGPADAGGGGAAPPIPPAQPPAGSGSSSSSTTSTPTWSNSTPSFLTSGSLTQVDPVRPEAVLPAPPAPPTPAATNLARRTITKFDSLGGGVNSSFRATLDDGSRAVWKPASGEAKNVRPNIANGTQHVREVAASRVAEILGVADLVPTTVRHVHEGQAGSLQRYADNAAHYPGGAGPAFTKHDAERMRVFDLVVGNTDRHRLNFLVAQRGGRPAPVLIDHGLSFPSGRPTRFLQPWAAIPQAKGPLSPETLTVIEKIDLQRLAATLLDSGLDDKAVQHALYRAELVKTMPHLLEVRAETGTRAWQGVATEYESKITPARRAELDAMVARSKRQP